MPISRVIRSLLVDSVREKGRNALGSAYSSLTPYVANYSVDASQFLNKIGVPSTLTEKATHNILEHLRKSNVKYGYHDENYPYRYVPPGMSRLEKDTTITLRRMFQNSSAGVRTHFTPSPQERKASNTMRRNYKNTPNQAFGVGTLGSAGPGHLNSDNLAISTIGDIQQNFENNDYIEVPGRKQLRKMRKNHSFSTGKFFNKQKYPIDIDIPIYQSSQPTQKLLEYHPKKSTQMTQMGRRLESRKIEGFTPPRDILLNQYQNIVDASQKRISEEVKKRINNGVKTKYERGYKKANANDAYERMERQDRKYIQAAFYGRYPEAKRKYKLIM